MDPEIQKAILKAAFVTGVDADQCLEVGADILPVLWGLIGYQEIQKDKQVEAVWRLRVLQLGGSRPELAGQINRLAADILVNPAWREWSLSNSQLQWQLAVASGLGDVADQLKDKNTLAKVAGWLFVKRAIGMVAVPPLAMFFTAWGKMEGKFAATMKAEMDRREKDGLFPEPRKPLGFNR